MKNKINLICKTKLMTAFFLMLFINLEAQTFNQTQLQQTYWNYRDRFRKMFVAIGSNAGESYPFENMNTNFEITPFNFNSNNPNQYPIIRGSVSYGDANITHGWYLAVLATEYFLLKTQGNDKASLLACQNELYFALNAINRVDGLSREYFNRGNMDPDGFLTRGDVNSDFLNRCRFRI